MGQQGYSIFQWKINKFVNDNQLTKIPGFTKSIITANTVTNNPANILTYNIKFPIPNPAPLKKSASPLPSVGFTKYGLTLGSSYASPTGYPSAAGLVSISIYISTYPLFYPGKFGCDNLTLVGSISNLPSLFNRFSILIKKKFIILRS